jgi:hypothetical protein
MHDSQGTKLQMINIEKPTPEQIRQLIEGKGVSGQDAAALLKVSRFAWVKWVTHEGSQNHRPIPAATWELLLLKLDAHPTLKLVKRVVD